MSIENRSSQIHSYVPGRKVAAAAQAISAAFSMDGAVSQYKQLSDVGIHFSNRGLRSAVEFIRAAMDESLNPLQPGLTTPSIITPVQFLQNFLPGFVRYITAERMIDTAIGMYTIGAFEDRQIVQGEAELTGQAVPYGDTSNIPFSSFNINWVYRTVEQFKLGMQVPMLQEMRASRARIDYASNVRDAAAEALEILRNAIGFFGFNDGLGSTYGLLNDPNETAYYQVPNGVAGTPQWSTKTYLEIWADIRLAASNLRTQSLERVNPHEAETTLLLPTSVVDQLDQINALGNQSVMQLIKATYPKMRVLSAPELDNAHIGDNVGYLYADKVNDSSTDDGVVFGQYVPSKFYMLGVERQIERFIEGYANATAGVLCKRPFANVRFFGI